MRIPKQSEPILRIRVPVKLSKDVGLGDVIKRVTNTIGIKTCGGCERRAAMLNRRFVFIGRHSK